MFSPVNRSHRGRQSDTVCFEVTGHSGDVGNQEISSTLSSTSNDTVDVVAEESRVVEPDVEIVDNPCNNDDDDEGPVDRSRRKRKTQPLPTCSDDEDGSSASKRKYECPAQDAAKNEIVSLDQTIDKLTKVKEKGLATEGTLKELEDAKKGKTALLKRLKKLASLKEAQSKYRKKIREAILSCQGLAKIKKTPGRPPNPQEDEIVRTIAEIALHGSAADERRRSDIIRTCRTLDDLHNALEARGFEISRSGTYLRILPRCGTSTEGKRHVRTAPVKLARAAADLHKAHPDSRFCTASIRNVEALASILQDDVAFISQDDKARIPLGITAANKQAPLLMRMDYRVKLPDHDWVVAQKHKLIPSVYAGIKITEKYPIGQPDAVTYSGPTYVAIRSGKHTSSTATSHAADFERLLQLDSFTSLMRTPTGQVKPVVIITVDGGPDENPRYRKVITEAINHFKSHDLDFMVVVTNAPGRSAYNRAERRMAPLSRALAGLVLPHEHYGSHLDDQRRTVDPVLEKRNFEFAGKALAEVWSSLVIDEESVTAEYIDPLEEDPRDENVDGDPGSEWYATHVRESQYMLQISKCLSKDCCNDFRSKVRLVLPEGFLPPPLLLTRDLKADAPLSADSHFAPLFIQLATRVSLPTDTFETPPYDFYCPSVQDQLKRRSCSICGLYFAAQVALKAHKSGFHSARNLVEDQEHRNPAGPTRRSKRLARRGGEVLTEIHDEMGDPLDVEWLPDESEEGPAAADDEDPDDDLPLMYLVRNIPDWTACPWKE